MSTPSLLISLLFCKAQVKCIRLNASNGTRGKLRGIHHPVANKFRLVQSYKWKHNIIIL